MTTLRTSPYLLLLNDEVVAMVRAKNLIGWGSFSTVTTSSATISTEPLKPPTVPYRGVDTSDVQIHVQWSPLTGDNTGQEDITGYDVEWDSGSNEATWYYLTSELTTFTYTYTQTSDISAGVAYHIRYRAINLHGVGDWSDSGTIYATAKPDQLSPVLTTNSDVDVVTTWSPTPSDRGAVVT